MTNIALYLAIILYGLLSSPTPDFISWVEITIIGLLIITVGVIRPIVAFTDMTMPMHLHYHKVFLGFMISIPMAIGVINGHDLVAIARDLFPIIALILPLCFYRQDMPLLPIIMAVAGGLFALRYLAPLIPYLGFLSSGDALLYLANSPLVPFAAIMGFHWASDIRDNSIMQRVFGLILCGLCFAAMGMMLQRAPFILCALACVGLLGLRTVQKPVQSMVLGAVIIMALVPVLPIIMDIAQSLQSKTLTVGMNNRVEEFQAVLAQSSWLGTGWGGEFQSPAVADIWVRFTHNIVSYYWLKAGVIGAILSVGFIALWGWQAIKIIRINPALGLAIAVPFLVHVTLYTGFKTLDFALLITLITFTKSGDVKDDSSKT